MILVLRRLGHWTWGSIFQNAHSEPNMQRKPHEKTLKKNKYKIMEITVVYSSPGADRPTSTVSTSPEKFRCTYKFVLQNCIPETN